MADGDRTSNGVDRAAATSGSGGGTVRSRPVKTAAKVAANAEPRALQAIPAPADMLAAGDLPAGERRYSLNMVVAAALAGFALGRLLKR